ncbi:MAG: hypothetical protein ACI8RD_013050 [Bacillariaceae sp.]|jgi:hypothetical protein
MIKRRNPVLAKAIIRTETTDHEMKKLDYSKGKIGLGFPDFAKREEDII